MIERCRPRRSSDEWARIVPDREPADDIGRKSDRRITTNRGKNGKFAPYVGHTTSQPLGSLALQ